VIPHVCPMLAAKSTMAPLCRTLPSACQMVLESRLLQWKSYLCFVPIGTNLDLLPR